MRSARLRRWGPPAATLLIPGLGHVLVKRYPIGVGLMVWSLAFLAFYGGFAADTLAALDNPDPDALPGLLRENLLLTVQFTAILVGAVWDVWRVPVVNDHTA